MGNNLLLANTGKRGNKPSDERYTPPSFLLRVDRFYGGRDRWFDPCPAMRGGDPDFDGLAIDWSDRDVYINPPFSNIKPWAAKFLNAPIRSGIMLVPGNGDSSWHQALRILPCIEMATPRLAFVFPDGIVKESPPMGCHIFYRGLDAPRFAAHFGDLGTLTQMSPLDKRWNEAVALRNADALRHALRNDSVTRYVTRYVTVGR